MIQVILGYHFVDKSDMCLNNQIWDYNDFHLIDDE